MAQLPFESMFAVGVDQMSWDDLNDAHYDWPNITQELHDTLDRGRGLSLADLPPISLLACCLRSGEQVKDRLSRTDYRPRQPDVTIRRDEAH